ncbi:MAG: Txe/YoeB family addiction module toxin [Synechococcaceae cyanobacterium SM2_3_2]|nr:Txe/YoeB family addiction module toxin [Synechococcaceae cyanobacterium SM2_3_2]
MPPLGGEYSLFGNVNFDQPAPSTENTPTQSEKSLHTPLFDADYEPQFEEDLVYWVKKHKKVARRIHELVESVLQDPFTGIGKPEHLKYMEPGTWSRRINQCHRLLYRVDDGEITFLAARYHYDKHPK